MATGDFIPIVDFKDVFSCDDLSSCPQVQELHTAFTKVGFVFITNHGIDNTLVKKLNSVSLDFFSLPMEVRKKYLYYPSGEKDTHHNGYIPYGKERSAMELETEKYTSKELQGQPKEVFDICSIEDCNYPDEEVPEFRPSVVELYREGKKLAFKILELVGYALKMKDPLFFVKKHSEIGNGCELNYSSLRCLYYPAFPTDFDFSKLPISPDNHQLRHGEHVDFGTLTLLFPDHDVGGLQVKKRDGSWITPSIIKDAVLINLGALVKRWTADKYLATPHRVIIPESFRHMPRQSIAIFCHPNADTILECIDGSNKYIPVAAKNEVLKRISKTVFTK